MAHVQDERWLPGDVIGRLRVVGRTGLGLDPWSDYLLWLTFCEGIFYSADNKLCCTINLHPKSGPIRPSCQA